MKTVFKNDTTIVLVDNEEITIQHESGKTISRVKFKIHELIKKNI